MPLKSYRGFNTGNTIKRELLHTWYSNPDGLLSVRTNRRDLQVENVEFDSHVQYSLKKKRRWMLREYIRQQMKEEDGPFAEDRIELVEGIDNGCKKYDTQYMLRKSANDDVRELFRKRGCINHRAVSFAMNQEENVDPMDNYVSFDIIHPARNCFVRFPRNHFRYRSCQTRQNTMVDVAPLSEDDEITAEARLQFLLDELEDEFDTGMEPGSSPPQHNLVDYVVPKMEKVPRRLRRSRTKSDSSDEGRPNYKGRKVIENDSEEVDLSEMTESTAGTWMEMQTSRVLDLNDSLEMKPERMQFESEQMKRRNLLSQYGERYLEADSTPRKFAISIGEELGKDITVYLIFEEVNAGPEYSIFDVFLNANVPSHLQSLQLFKVSENDQETVNDIVDLVSECVTRVREDLGPLLIKRAVPIVVSYKKRPSPLENEPVDNRRVDVLREPDNPEWSKAVFNRQNSRPAASDDWELIAGEEFELIDPVCGICFEPVESKTNFRSIEGAGVCLAPSCTLNACGHQFCHDCWRKHLIAGIRQGLSTLKCPENDCHEAVDVVTVMRFVSLSVHSQHATRVETNQVECDPAAVWCPNRHCGRAVRLEQQPKSSTSLPINVECACGTSFCFTCREEAHWPAHCSSYQIYKAKLQLLGDLGLTLDPDPSVQVTGKVCPSCNVFMEKNGGCNQMSCRCGASFCWFCGDLTRNHNFSRPCYSDSERVMKKFENHEFRGESLPPSAVRSKQYCNTVKWRAMRLNTNSKHRNYLHLNRSAIREFLFKNKKRQGWADINSEIFQAINLETVRVDRNYEEILRVVEFCHVAAMALVKAQLPTARILRNCAHRLAYLAMGIRDCIQGHRVFSVPREKVLQNYFAEARQTADTILSLAALRNPRLLRKTL